MNCNCGLDKTYEECCGAIISGKKQALTPEKLMRSRYSAYVNGAGIYLIQSTVTENQHPEDIELIEEHSQAVEWLKLDIIAINTTLNTVEFKAYYRENEKITLLHEKSNFIKQNNVWKYKDGELYNSKIERNEPCPCGSGKKYKKCCA